MNKKVALVTGAGGFIGKNACSYFAGKGWGVYKHKSKIKQGAMFGFAPAPDLIIHCAGSSSVGESFLNSEKDFESNVLSLLPVLKFMNQKCPNSRLIYLSSVAVYGNQKDAPIKETSPLKPVSPYGYSKLIAEKLCESYSKNFGLNISVIRFFSIYGPGLKKQLLWDASQKFRNSSKKVVFYGTGKETRDFIYITDALNLIETLSLSRNKFEVLNGGSGERTEVRKIINLLGKSYKTEAKAVFNGEKRKGDPKFCRADISKALEKSWKPEIKLRDGLNRYADFYKGVYNM